MRAYLKMRLFLPFKNLKDSSLVTSFLSSSQKGAASLVVVALLLAGITAAVYLTQTGTSFLPQAQQSNSVWDCSQAFISSGYDLEKVSKDISRCYDKGQRAKISHCEHVNNSTGAASDTLRVTDEASKKTCVEFMKTGALPGYTNKIYCYWDPPQCSTAATQPTAQANGISSTACSAQQKQLCDTEPWQPKGGCVITTTGLRQCKYEASREGDRCNNDPAHPETGAACGSKECRVIDGLPRCITNTCTQGEKTGCEAKGATCEIGTKKIDGVDKNYTYCKPGTTPTAQRPAAGAPAAPQSNTGQRPQSAQAPSTTKTPWDKDADGDSKLISQVFALAAKDLSKSYDNAKDGIDAAKKARTAYENQFKKAYSDTFKADISKDADALAVLSRELDNVAVHAYISKEHPGMSWETAKSTGKVEAAINNLKRPEVGVISQNSQITASNVSTPGSAPSASAPRRLTIDPTVAVNCGTDLDGTQIPCYQIGVFASFDDLKATEAQASIATQRYAKSQEILTAAKGKVDEAILAAAQAKLDAAKAKAEACMPK